MHSVRWPRAATGCQGTPIPTSALPIIAIAVAYGAIGDQLWLGKSRIHRDTAINRHIELPHGMARNGFMGKPEGNAMHEQTQAGHPKELLLPTDVARVLCDPAFRKNIDALVQARWDAVAAPAWFQQIHPQAPLNGVAARDAYPCGSGDPMTHP